MNSAINSAKSDYIRIWRSVLVGWLGWTDARFEAFVRWEEARGGFENPMGVLHEAPMTEIIPLIVPDALIAKEGIRVGWEFEQAAGIRLGYEDADWTSAKERVSALFARYGHSIPDRDYVSTFERRFQTNA